MPLSPAFGRKERKLGFFFFPLAIFQVIVTPLDATLTSRIIRYTPKRTGASSTRPAGTWPSTASKRRRLSLVILDLRLVRGLLGIEHARTHARHQKGKEENVAAFTITLIEKKRFPSMATTIDNSGEPKPLINEKSTILGILIPFMVSSPQANNHHLLHMMKTIRAPPNNVDNNQVVQWICVSLRFWSRSKLRCLGYDDAFVLIAAVSVELGPREPSRCQLKTNHELDLRH